MASVYTHRNFYTDKLLHTASFYTQNLLHTASFYRKEFYTEKLSSTSSQQELQLQNRISTPTRKKDDFEAPFKRTLKRKITSAKVEKICWQITVAALMQPVQYYLQDAAAKDNVLRMQLRHEATLMQSLQCDLQRLSCKTQ